MGKYPTQTFYGIIRVKTEIDTLTSRDVTQVSPYRQPYLIYNFPHEERQDLEHPGHRQLRKAPGCSKEVGLAELRLQTSAPGPACQGSSPSSAVPRLRPWPRRVGSRVPVSSTGKRHFPRLVEGKTQLNTNRAAATVLARGAGPHLPCLSLVRLHQLPGVLVLGSSSLQLGAAGVAAAGVPAVRGRVAELSGESKAQGRQPDGGLGDTGNPNGAPN